MLISGVLLLAAMTVATVGDSFADATYLGMRLQPELLAKYDIRAVRWSRPAIGLSRSDYFDYAAWLRGPEAVGVADFCVVQIGANDRQSIPANAPGKWITLGTEEWKEAYRGRVRDLVEELEAQRCRHVIWLLRGELQTVAASAGALVLSVEAAEGDYGRDGIHFNGPFTLKLADAVVRTVSGWRDVDHATCFSCHTRVGAQAFTNTLLLPLGARPESGMRAGGIALGELARSFTPAPPTRPKLVAAARGGRRRNSQRHLGRR